MGIAPGFNNLQDLSTPTAMKSKPEFPFIPYRPAPVGDDEALQSSENFYREISKRRSCRFFSDRPVPQKVIENLIMAAASAPSGANKQPWRFVAVADSKVKKQIRKAAEKEEKEFYENRAPKEWLEDLAPLGTDWRKPFLEKAPWLIVAFKKSYEDGDDGRSKNYYVQESVGIACGFLISAIHNAGLVTLTHTPSPMNFLAEVLERPANEKPFLLLPVGHAGTDAVVPDIERKPLEDVSVFI